MPGRISRRAAVGLLGAGGLAGALIVGGGAASGPSGAAIAEARAALPLVVGQRFARWTVTAVHPVEDGALRVGVKGVDEREFILEVLAADMSPLAPRPPAATEALAIFVRNGGDGWLPTAEEQGLAAMTLASVLTNAGAAGPVAGLLTHAARVVEHHAKLMGEGPSETSRTV
jgi:hypothetical protein